MSIDDILPILPLATKIAQGESIRRFAIGPEYVTSWVNSYGAQVLIPNQSAVRKVMRQALNIQ